MRSWKIALGALLLAGVSTSALAQAAPQTPAPTPAQKAAPARPATGKPAPGKDGKTVEEVTVTAGAPDVQTSIDRRSYTLGKDLQATTGSIADALRNVPAVEIDLQGNLTMRGDPNVTILVDGRPSGAFNGSGRADALQQLPADQIERVEVVTVPSAADNPEGSGGIINLITKKSRGAGKTGSVYVTAGSAGVYRGGGTFGYNSKKLSVSAYLSGFYQNNKFVGEEVRSTLIPATGQFLDTRVDSLGRNLNRGPNGRFTLGYAIDPKTQLSASLDFSEQVLHGRPFSHFETGGATGPLISVVNRQGARYVNLNSFNGALGWRRTLPGDGHLLSFDLSVSEFSPDDYTLNTSTGAPPIATPYDSVLQAGTSWHTEFKAAYSRPLPNSAKLRAGYELRYDDEDHINRVARGATLATLAPDLGFSNQLLYNQAVNSAYATYERPFGDLTVQAGLRLEDVRRDLELVTTHVTDNADYSRAYPSLHFDYKLDDGKKVSGGYSVRVQRPPAVLLTPFIAFADPKNQQQGNPDLKPAETRSFEVAYELRKGQTLYLATAYYRRNKNQFTPIFRDLGNNVFLTTYDNLGASRSAGLELVANGRLSKKLTYNASTNLYWTQINSGVASFGGERTATGIGGRANLNWQVRADDLVQLNAFAQGPQLAAQGQTDAIYSVNLGWRHKVNDRVTATVTAQDLFDTNHFTRSLDTPALRDYFAGYPLSRSISIRLDYRFGGGPARGAREPGFEYENAAPAAPQ